jgi:hypothetical protein
MDRTQAADDVSLEEQIASVRREIKLRQAVYPKWVAGGRMKQVNASREIAAMIAVQTTLEALHGIPGAYERLRQLR